jgi:hypothetical protein
MQCKMNKARGEVVLSLLPSPFLAASWLAGTQAAPEWAERKVRIPGSRALNPVVSRCESLEV